MVQQIHTTRPSRLLEVAIGPSLRQPLRVPDALWAAAKLPPKITSKYIFFFGYEGDEPEVCFQQWFPAPFAGPKKRYDDMNGEMVEFGTSEQFMMYHKSLLMNDNETAAKILEAEHPSDAKKLGRQVKNFDQELWNANADGVVEKGNWFKFSDGRNGDMGKVLVSTGEKEIVEASPDDRIWGIGFDSDNAEGKENEWGNNGLGKALMKVRERLRKEK